MKRTILVTGGTGYIGSHTSVALAEQGHNVVIVDNLSNSSPAVVEVIERLGAKSVHFHELDLTDGEALAEVFAEHPIESVVHFAGLKAVGESVEKPLWYYRTNLLSTVTLLEQMEAHKVHDLVFSSSATVYGDPETLPIVESAPTGATNPYGQTKLMIENICRDVAAANPRWQMAMLRYFNPIGAHPSGDLGEDPTGIPNNLVPFVMQVAVGRREKLEIFGDDWDTPDGTGVRDYIHVLDLAAGHLAALENLKPGWHTYNLGTGSGASVLEIVETTENVTGVPINYSVVARRSGDIATSLADPTKANSELGWRADRNLQSMIVDAWKWQSKNPNGFEDDTKD